MFKNNFFRKVCILQLIILLIICISSNYSDFVVKHIGFLLSLIFLIPYEFIFTKDFKDYLKEYSEKRKEMKD